MNKYNTIALLDSLQADTRSLIDQATRLQSLDPEFLLTQPQPGAWSVIQVIEHLNSYSRFYLPVISTAIQHAPPARDTFKPGWFGNYFTKLMAPKDGQVKNKMKAMKGHKPSLLVDARPVITTFLQQQHELLQYLEQSKSKHIGGIRVPISISRLIKLKLGDTFRFLIAHEQRHFVQVQNTLRELQATTGKFPAGHLAV